METRSNHLLVEFFDCNKSILQSQTMIENLMNAAAKASNVTILQSAFHKFSPQGITGIIIISESHLSIHTWPEYGYASVDFYTCGDGNPENAYEVLLQGLEAKHSEKIMVGRGLSLNNSSMKLEYHNRVSHFPVKNTNTAKIGSN